MLGCHLCCDCLVAWRSATLSMSEICFSYMFSKLASAFWHWRTDARVHGSKTCPPFVSLSSTRAACSAACQACIQTCHVGKYFPAFCRTNGHCAGMDMNDMNTSLRTCRHCPLNFLTVHLQLPQLQVHWSEQECKPARRACGPSRSDQQRH